MAHQRVYFDKFRSIARGQPDLVETGPDEEDEMLALGAEAYAWCCPLALALAGGPGRVVPDIDKEV